jgi:hypothetical protein
MTDAPVRFLQLSHRNCGEVALMMSLAGHPAIRMRAELMHRSDGERARIAGPDAAPYQLGEDGAAYVKAHGFAVGSQRRAKAAGFMMFYDSARLDHSMITAWDALIEDTDIRIVHVTRRDLLAWQVAEGVVARTPAWLNPFKPDPGYDVEPFSATFHQFRGAFDQVSAEKLWARRAFARHQVLELEYETDIVGDLGGAVRRVCDFVGVDPAPMGFRIQPLAPRRPKSPAEQLVNFAELREAFELTPYEDLFHGVSGEAA